MQSFFLSIRSNLQNKKCNSKVKFLNAIEAVVDKAQNAKQKPHKWTHKIEQNMNDFEIDSLFVRLLFIYTFAAQFLLWKTKFHDKKKQHKKTRQIIKIIIKVNTSISRAKVGIAHTVECWYIKTVTYSAYFFV